jgi:hypothetical protein
MSQKVNRPWTTLWDRQNHRVLLLAGPKNNDYWGFVEHDPKMSLPGIYDIWRLEEDIVFVEIHLDETDNPLGFPSDLLNRGLLGSQTIWPHPDMPAFIWWHTPSSLN